MPPARSLASAPQARLEPRLPLAARRHTESRHPAGQQQQQGDQNRLGHVVGLSTTALWETHAVLRQNGGNTDLGTLPRGTRSVAQAINASGRVAGSSSTSTGATNAVTW